MPARLLGLVAGAGGQHHEHRDRLRVRQVGRQDAQAVVERVAFEHRHRARSYRRIPHARRADETGDRRQPEWLAQVPTDRRFPEGARLLFTGCGTSFHAAHDRGRRGAGARARPPSGTRRRPARARLPRGRDAAHARGCARLARPALARHRPGRRADRRAVRRGRRLHAGDRGELVPHRELHVRGRRDRGAARRGHLVAAGGRRGGARRRLPTSASQERSLVAGAGRDFPPRTRRC